MAPETLARIGVAYIENAVITTLFKTHPEWQSVADLTKSIGIKSWDTDGWIPSVILPKLEYEGRVEAQYIRARAVGWKLTSHSYTLLLPLFGEIQ